MGESQSGGGVDTDVGGAGRDVGGANYGQSPGAMGGRQPNTVPDVRPSIYGKSFDPGVYSEPETSIVPSFDGPMGSGASTNAAVRDLQRFGSGIAALTGGSRPEQTFSPSFTPSSSTSGTMPTVQGPADRRMSFSPSGGTGVSPEQVRSERMFAEPAYVSLYNNPDPMILQPDSVPFYDDMGGRRFIPPGSDTGFPPDAPAYDPTDATDAALRRAVPALNASYNRAPYPMGGGTSRPDYNINNLEAGRPGMDDLLGDPLIYAQDRPIDRRPRPDADEMTRYVSPIGFDTRDMGRDASRPDFVFDYGYGSMPFGKGDTRNEALDAVGTDFFGEGTLGSLGTDEATTLANLVTTGKKGNAKQEAQKKTIGQRLQELGKKISDFSFSDFIGFVGDVLRGDPNYKGPSEAQLQLAQVPGPGPAVGGGVPSPSGVGGAPSAIQCPPGFKFDPVQNICVPIVAPAPPVTTPPAPGTTAPAPATGGISAIPNVYPFTLTPPIGAPIGNIAPVRS